MNHGGQESDAPQAGHRGAQDDAVLPASAGRGRGGPAAGPAAAALGTLWAAGGGTSNSGGAAAATRTRWSRCWTIFLVPAALLSGRRSGRCGGRMRHAQPCCEPLWRQRQGLLLQRAVCHGTAVEQCCGRHGHKWQSVAVKRTPTMIYKLTMQE